MNVIQVKSNEVLEGMLHGFMHKGVADEAHTHSPPDVVYISTSDRAAEFEVRGILRKNNVPNNFLVSGYGNLLYKIRGRTLGSVVVFVSPECLHVDRDLMTGCLAQLIEHNTSVGSQWVRESSMVIHGPSSAVMVEGLQARLYRNYLERNPMFYAGSTDLESNITMQEFHDLMEETSLLKSPMEKQILASYYFGDEFMQLNTKQFYNDLCTLHQRMPSPNSLVLSPKLMYHVYCQRISYLRPMIATL
ncbi:hypothetical protein pEaSNUABM5_00252 [Erwinia phage pEa_SNUABM_5]|uniref:Uncharacterized protein n=1 Tax=Erwinia phage pEa_SNUABM_5 TaxID=2797313 RepID=A0A7T8IWA2_9CAUD|nr:hypothetical protein MPK73_gp252 [Erwinia phage pEa_SNUABM_5]QQO90394.1 hypothetical protein pEaSNUABM5_00252 [Erwinia phage pEa_SNUABM_5]